MSAPRTVILAPRISDDSKAVWATCLELVYSPRRIQGWRVPEDLRNTNNQIIIYGEPLFAEAVADQMGLALLEPAIDWLTTIPKEHLSRKIETTTLKDARTRIESAFVKPADGKIFEPRVYEKGSDLPGEEHVDGDIYVLRSGIVHFELEVRCFLKGRSVITHSPYWRNGNLAEDSIGEWPYRHEEESEAMAFANSVLADDRVTLPPSCTLDVGKTTDHGWAIIEANPIWGAGLYGCDPKSVLKAIPDSIIPRENVRAEHRPWISKCRSFFNAKR